MEITPVKPFLTVSLARHGEKSGSVTAVVLPTVTINSYAIIKAQTDNAGNVYVGSSSAVTIPNGTTDTTSGYPLDAGQELELYGTNLNQFYIICDNAGDDISYLVY